MRELERDRHTDRDRERDIIKSIYCLFTYNAILDERKKNNNKD